MLELALLIVAAATAITLGYWVITHLGGGLSFFALPTLAWAALVSLVYLVQLGVEWIQSRQERARRIRAAIPRKHGALPRSVLAFSVAAAALGIGLWLLRAL